MKRLKGEMKTYEFYPYVVGKTSNIRLFIKMKKVTFVDYKRYYLSKWVAKFIMPWIRR